MSRVKRVGQHAIEIDDDGLVRVDGIPLCQRIEQGGQLLILLKDKRNSDRTRQRGTELVSISCQELVDILENGWENGSEPE